MTQFPGKTLAPGSEVVAPLAPSSKKKSIKRVARMTVAGVISAGMVGVFALPAYATYNGPRVESLSYAQALTTLDVETLATLQGPSVEAIPAAQAVAVEAVPAADEANGEASVEAAPEAPTFADIPAGAGASGIVAAALAQLGVGQDCTDLVQNALGAVGYVTPRLQGGPDLGANLGSWTGFGSEVSLDSLAPGDILVYTGSVHVAIYVGNGMAVHGGFPGGTDLAGVHAPWGHLSHAVRPA